MLFRPGEPDLGPAERAPASVAIAVRHARCGRDGGFDGRGFPRRVRSRAGMTAERFSEERLDAGLGAAEHQRVDVVRALIGVDGFEIAQHAHDMEFVGDAVAAVHVARERARCRAPCRNCCA